jgi:hypothetical protein
MAFVRATIQIKPAGVGTGVKCSLRQTKKSAAAMTLFINPVVAKTFDFADGNKLEVMIGDGEHHGLIRLRKNNSVGEATVVGRETGNGAFFQIKLGHQPAFIDRSEPSAWCQFEQVEDGWVEIVLPKWADETAPRKAAQPNGVTRPAAAPPAPVAPKRQVTAAVMGDPPPGRRQMLETIGNIKP